MARLSNRRAAWRLGLSRRGTGLHWVRNEAALDAAAAQAARRREALRLLSSARSVCSECGIVIVETDWNVWVDAATLEAGSAVCRRQDGILYAHVPSRRVNDE